MDEKTLLTIANWLMAGATQMGEKKANTLREIARQAVVITRDMYDEPNDADPYCPVTLTSSFAAELDNIHRAMKEEQD